jgi:hypothetical protein
MFQRNALRSTIYKDTERIRQIENKRAGKYRQQQKTNIKIHKKY